MYCWVASAPLSSLIALSIPMCKGNALNLKERTNEQPRYWRMPRPVGDSICEVALDIYGWLACLWLGISQSNKSRAQRDQIKVPEAFESECWWSCEHGSSTSPFSSPLISEAWPEHYYLVHGCGSPWISWIRHCCHLRQVGKTTEELTKVLWERNWTVAAEVSYPHSYI